MPPIRTGCGDMLKPSTAVLCLAVVAMAQPAAAQTKKAADENATFSSRKDHKDGSSSLTFGTKLPTTVETKLGVDLGLAGPGELGQDPGKLLEKPDDRNAGAGWASMVIPGTPLGFSKAKVDARLDPTQDQGKFGVAVSRPLGEGLLMTLQSSYAVTGNTVPVMPTPTGHHVETGRILRFDVLATDTALSAGTKSSTTDDKSFRMLSAEQKIIGPLSVTGSVSETPTGLLDRTLKAGFKKTW
jgi:hypothetical protein